MISLEWRIHEGSDRNGKKRGRFLCLVNFFLLLGFLGTILYPIWGMPVWAKAKKTDSTELSSRSVGPMVKLKPLIINLKEASGRHYLKTTIVLEIGSQEWREKVQKRIPSLTDMVILTVGEKSLKDLQQPQSKEELKKELLAKANKTLDSKIIKHIYFDEFLFQ